MLRSTVPNLAWSIGERACMRVGKGEGGADVGARDGAGLVGVAAPATEHAGSSATRASKTSKIGLRIFCSWTGPSITGDGRVVKRESNRWYNAAECKLGC